MSLCQGIINTMCGQGMQDFDYQRAGEFINTNGCIDKVVNWIHSNLFLLGGIALGLAIPQVTSIISWRLFYAFIFLGFIWSDSLSFYLFQLFGILLSQVLITQIQDQIKLQNYNLLHRSDPWSWSHCSVLNCTGILPE